MQDRLQQTRNDRQAALEEQASIPEDDLTANDALLEQWREQVLGEHSLELRLLTAQQKSMRDAMRCKARSMQMKRLPTG